MTHPVVANAHYVTYTSATSALTVWGLHLSDIAVMVSALAAICGAVIQVISYLDRRAERRSRGEETSDHGEAERGGPT